LQSSAVPAASSHASPVPFELQSRWSGFATVVQLSLQSATPSASPSASATPQPHAPGSVFAESAGQPTQDLLVQIIPEPGTLVLVSIGIAGLAIFRRKKSVK